MDKQLYYRIVVLVSLLSVYLFFAPSSPIRSVIGSLVMFGEMGLYHCPLHKEGRPASVHMKKTGSEDKK